MLSSINNHNSAREVADYQDERAAGLARAAARGDEAAFAELYTLFGQRVFNFVLRSVHQRAAAEDLCQEIWLKVHHELRNLRTPEAFRAWLYRIATNACIDLSRSSRAVRASDEEVLEDFIQASGPLPEDAAINGSQLRMVWETLATMAPRQSIALYLKQVEGRTYEEIGSILNCSRESVESLLFRARESFVRAYDRVQSSPVERCALFQHVVAGILDDEPTQLQKSAILAHMQDCRACRTQLPGIAAAAKGYSLLPLLPFTKAIAVQTLIGGAAAGTAVVAPAAVGGVVAGLPLKAKLAALLGLFVMGASGAATTTLVNVPGVPDIGAVFEQDSASEEDGVRLIQAGQGTDEQASMNALVNTPAGANNIGATTRAAAPGAGSRDTDSSAGPESADEGRSDTPAPPAATAALLDGGADATPPPENGSAEDTLDTLLEEPIELIGDLTGGALGATLGALDDTLEGVDGTLDSVAGLTDSTLGNVGGTVDEVLAPVEPVIGVTVDEVLAPVEPVLDGLLPADDLQGSAGDALDDVLPDGEDQSGPLGGLLSSSPSVAQPPATPPEPEGMQPPASPCLLGILC